MVKCQALSVVPCGEKTPVIPAPGWQYQHSWGRGGFQGQRRQCSKMLPQTHKFPSILS